MREVLVNRLGGLSLPRKSVVRITDRPDMTLDVYRGRKTTTQQQQFVNLHTNELNYTIYVCCTICCSYICIVCCVRGVYDNLLPVLANTSALFIMFFDYIII